MGESGCGRDAIPRPTAKVSEELKVRIEIEVTQGIVLEDTMVEECQAFIGVFFKEDGFGMTVVGGVSKSQIESAYLRLGQYLGDQFDEREDE